MYVKQRNKTPGLKSWILNRKQKKTKAPSNQFALQNNLTYYIPTPQSTSLYWLFFFFLNVSCRTSRWILFHFTNSTPTPRTPLVPILYQTYRTSWISSPYIRYNFICHIHVHHTANNCIYSTNFTKRLTLQAKNHSIRSKTNDYNCRSHCHIETEHF